MRSREGDLRLQCGVTGLTQYAALRFVEHQTRHQVLKHRAGPGAQSGVRTAGKKRAPQAGPVAHRQIALGDRQQAGQARLRRQQVVEAGVKLVLCNAVADVQQVPFGVVQECKVGLPGQLLAGRRQRLQTPRRLDRARNAACAARSAGLNIEPGRAQGGELIQQTPGQFITGRGRCGDGRFSPAGQQL